MYQNFDYINNVKEGEEEYYGGSVTLADFCPFIQEFTWRSKNVIHHLVQIFVHVQTTLFINFSFICHQISLVLHLISLSMFDLKNFSEELMIINGK